MRTDLFKDKEYALSPYIIMIYQYNTFHHSCFHHCDDSISIEYSQSKRLYALTLQTTPSNQFFPRGYLNTIFFIGYQITTHYTFISHSSNRNKPCSYLCDFGDLERERRFLCLRDLDLDLFLFLRSLRVLGERLSDRPCRCFLRLRVLKRKIGFINTLENRMVWRK